LDSAKPNPNPKLRLQKFLAECGFGSRRSCEELILSGVVSVDGQPVTQLGTKVDPSQDRVQVRGKEARMEPRFTAVINKPPRIICTSRDPHGRKTVLDLLRSPPARLYTVGRLDYHSTGLLLLTNEGELAHRLTHPRYHVEKEYRVRLTRPLTDQERERLCHGVQESGELLQAVSIKKGATPSESLWILRDGRNRQIRRMASVLGVEVTRLERIRMGDLELGTLAQGEWRPLTREEKKMLASSVGL